MREGSDGHLSRTPEFTPDTTSLDTRIHDMEELTKLLALTLSASTARLSELAVEYSQTAKITGYEILNQFSEIAHKLSLEPNASKREREAQRIFRSFSEQLAELKKRNPEYTAIAKRHQQSAGEGKYS